ncbi:MAG: chorismate mutase [Bacteroidales bacterium]|nr:chorismate mutase [Bacteroidales bacterium]MDD4670079.1 chorismate mutase [Bacteroidales bacterium]
MAGINTFICGPCSAESEEQVLRTAEALNLIFRPDGTRYVTAFRAGLWKPRTHPGAFEGVGEKGIPWMVRVRKELGMKVIVEVANPAHLESVLKAGLDMIWIGSRTTTNPFAMQDLADALKGVDIPVYIKNPINPDVELWIGAFERFQRAGIRQLAAIHRGFSFYEKSKYRNVPKWQVPIDLKQRFGDIPLLCDASHIAGKREYIPEISQKAMDLGFDGLFIESHINPDAALSDARQQLTPSAAESLIKGLIIRDVNSENTDYLAAIEHLRAHIDVIDDNLLDLLSTRMEIVDKIGRYKRDNNITILQQHRWEEVLNKVVAEGVKKGLDESFIQELFKLIHQASIERQS